MKTLAIIATATIAGSIAFAAGQTSISKRSLSTLPQSNHGLASTVVAESSLPITEGCAVGERLDWFIRAHRLPQCFAEQWGTASLLEWGQYEDIDGDGKDDHLIAMHYRDIGTGCVAVHSSHFEWGEGYTCPVPPFQWYEIPVLWKPVFGVAGEVTVLTLRPVLFFNDVRSLVSLKVAPGNSDVFAFKMLGYFDVDRDGDLDLLIHASGVIISQDGGEHPQFSDDFWLENNAISAAPPAADLNRDGRVDGADLALLLYAWGQTQ